MIRSGQKRVRPARLRRDCVPACEHCQVIQEIAIRAAGANLHAEQRGPNPQAVFLHGFGSDLRTWDGLWEVLGDDLPALRYDLRGSGRSVWQQNVQYNHADDLAVVLDTASIEHCDLIGVSMGGSIALNFALDHPERVRSLTLISPGLVGWEWSNAWVERWRPIVNRARDGAINEANRLWWEHPLFSTTRESNAGPALFESIVRYSGAQWISDRHVRLLPDVERLHSLRARTLLLTGGLDLEDFRLIAAVIEASVPDLERIDDPGRGHLIHLEDPVGCAHKIKSFLAFP
jgi:pimeloyl-ACP methyl ester carboxylesterase